MDFYALHNWDIMAACRMFFLSSMHKYPREDRFKMDLASLTSHTPTPIQEFFVHQNAFPNTNTTRFFFLSRIIIIIINK
jgi:hypothetical protein